MPQKAKPVTIKGVTYANAHEAAKAFNVSYSAVISAKRRGTLNTLGVGAGNNKNAIDYERLKNGIASKPISIQGVEYPSKKIAAEVLGVAVATIIRAEKKGYLDKVGRGVGRPKNDET